MRYVKLITLGYDQFASDILWFNTLNYFGKQFEGNKDLHWFGHMCELVSSLDEKARHVYEFCATLLSWVAKEPQKSAELLSKAISAEPDYWRYRYLRGFNYWYFLDRRDLAQKDLSYAAKLKDAPPFLASLASRLMASDDHPRTAIAFLKDLIENTNDRHAKQALKEKLKLAQISYDLHILREKAAEYQAKYGAAPKSFSELVEAKMLRGIPLDPYGRAYRIDRESGEIRSKSGEQGLEFFGKTAKTGLARHDN